MGIDPRSTEKAFHGQVVELAHAKGWHQLYLYHSDALASGVPDLCLLKVSDDSIRLLFAELKRERGGRLSRKQRFWLDSLSKVPGAEVYLWRPSHWAEIVEVLTITAPTAFTSTWRANELD